jgi:putative hydrolase of the HAD superfamily
MRNRALIFDFDGLIVDSERACYAAWLEIFRGHGHELTVAEWHAAIGHVDRYDPVAALEARTGIPLDRHRLQSDHKERFLGLFEKEEPMPGVRELIAAGKAAGYRLGVASNASSDWVGSGLKRFGLLDAFDVYFGRDRVARPKPAPDVYLAVLRGLGCDAAGSWAFEDSEPGVAAAAAAGLTVIAVPNDLTRHADFGLAHSVLDSLHQFALPAHGVAPASTICERV